MLKFVKYFSLIFFLISGNIVSSAENAEILLTSDWTLKDHLESLIGHPCKEVIRCIKKYVLHVTH